MRLIQPRRRNDRGAAMVSTALVLTALIALTVVGVDVGRLGFTATEVQNTADIAAVAAATSMMEGQSASSGAAVVLGQNVVEGKNAVDNLDGLEIGSYDPATNAFTPGGTPAIAVRASASATVNNTLAGFFGTPTSHVVRMATAAFSSLGAGTPTLPMAIGDDMFVPDCYDDSCLPQLIQVPSPDDNTAWTGFFEGANTSNIGDYFPTECGGDGETVPIVSVGDSITLNNGQESPLLNKVECLVNMGITEFLIPVVDASQFTQTATVVGFVTVVVDSVKTTGNPKGATLHAIFSATEPGPPGGGNFGTGSVHLVG